MYSKMLSKLLFNEKRNFFVFLFVFFVNANDKTLFALLCINAVIIGSEPVQRTVH